MPTDFRQMVEERRLPPPWRRKALREESGFSVNELAESLGVTRQALWRWERGDREPKGENRQRYAGFLEAAWRTIGDA